jgi:hypothetical protein
MFDDNAQSQLIAEKVISAATAAASIDINSTIFKTIGDNNMFLYALANNLWAMTGDKAAAAQYLFLSYMLENGAARAFINGQYFDAGAKFIFESAKPAQNKIILFQSLKGNDRVSINEQLLTDITKTDYCLGKAQSDAYKDTTRPTPPNFMQEVLSRIQQTPMQPAVSGQQSFYGQPGEPSQAYSQSVGMQQTNAQPAASGQSGFGGQSFSQGVPYTPQGAMNRQIQYNQRFFVSQRNNTASSW